MKSSNKARAPILLTVAALLFASWPVRAEMSAEELAKLAQNPVGNLISVPFQNNTNFNVGPLNGTQNILNIQPVVPIEINSQWNVITRTIVPVIWQPALSPTIDSPVNTQLSAYYNVVHPDNGANWQLRAQVQFMFPK